MKNRDDFFKTIKYVEWLKQTIIYDDRAEKAQSKNIRTVYRGQVYYCDLGVGIGSEEDKNRPCLIIQNDVGNIHSPNTIVAPITNQSGVPKVTVEIKNTYKYFDPIENIEKQLSGYILLGNIVTVSKIRLGALLTTVDKEMNEVNEKLLSSIGMYGSYKKLNTTVDKNKKFITKQNKRIQELEKAITDMYKHFEETNEENYKKHIDKLVKLVVK